MLLEAPLHDEEKCDWLQPITAWLAKRSRVLLPAESQLEARSPAARLWLFVRVLERNPHAAARLGALVRILLAETSALHLFCDAGMGGQQSFAGEVMARISSRIVPTASDDAQLDEVVSQLFPDKRTAHWLVMLPDALLHELWRLLFATGPHTSSTPACEPWHLLRDDLVDAVIILGGRVSAHALENDVRLRTGPAVLRESPFFTLSRSCREAAELFRCGADLSLHAEKLAHVQSSLVQARALLVCAMEHQEANGVSVDLVHRLERMGRQLTRIQQLLQLLDAPPLESAALSRRLFATLTSQMSDDRSLRHLVQSSVQQLARKIVESAGATGEHYIAATPREYRAMLRSAACAGLLTSVTTLIKYSLADLPLPPFILGTLSSLNYAVSFLFLYFLGWTLATKQPAATAATLARAMRQLDTDEDLSRVVEQIACTTRSQIAAIAGNLCTVIPGCVALDLLWSALAGHHFFSLPQAEHALRSLHPVRSGLVIYAALTGVLLWASSIAAGWCTNWANYRRVPETIARSRTLLRIFGPARRARLAAAFTRNLSGVSGNIALGFLLGMAPFVGAFFGLPTEIRHVTLSTGLVALAASAFGTPGVAQAAFFWALLGIAIIGALNFFVSFRLALWLASRACALESGAISRLRRAVAEAFWKSPRRFLLPPA